MFDVVKSNLRILLKQKNHWLSGLVKGDAIENTAYIYFDFNPPIVTNTTVNTNNYPLNLSEEKEPILSIYPNPIQVSSSNNQINFAGAQVQNVVIYDMLGQVVLSSTISENSVTVSDLSSGVYFVEMQTNGEKVVQRLVVNK